MNSKVAKRIRKELQYQRTPVAYVSLFNSRKSGTGTKMAVGLRGIYRRAKKIVKKGGR